MELLEALENLKNPNDKFDLDLIALRVVVLSLVQRLEEKPKPKKKVEEE